MRGEALPEVDSENIIAILKVGEEYQEIEDTSAVVYKYYNASNSSEVTDGKVPATGTIYIGAVYLGAKTGDSRINVPTAAMIDEASTSYVWPGVSFFKTAETYTAPAKQFYDDINDVISALSVEDLVFTPFTVDEKEITVDPASVEVYYSTTNSDLTGGTAVGSTGAISGSKLSTTALTDSEYDSDNGNSSLTGENVYIVAEYPVFDAKTNKTTIYVASVVVDLEEPVVENTELVLSYADTKEDEIPLVGKAVKFAIKTSNADGLIALVDNNVENNKTYTLLIDGKTVSAWSSVKVTDKQQNVVLYETANSTKNVKGVIPALTGYLLFGGASGGAMAYIGLYAGGLAVVLGHNFPVFAHFKGGKGVACLLGIFLVARPIETLIAIVVVFVYLCIFDYAAVGSFILITAITLCEAYRIDVAGYDSTLSLVLKLFLFVLFFLTWFMHRQNIFRMLIGKENKINLVGAMKKLGKKNRLAKKEVKREEKNKEIG